MYPSTRDLFPYQIMISLVMVTKSQHPCKYAYAPGNTKSHFQLCFTYVHGHGYVSNIRLCSKFYDKSDGFEVPVSLRFEQCAMSEPLHISVSATYKSLVHYQEVLKQIHFFLRKLSLLYHTTISDLALLKKNWSCALHVYVP